MSDYNPINPNMPSDINPLLKFNGNPTKNFLE